MYLYIYIYVSIHIYIYIYMYNEACNAFGSLVMYCPPGKSIYVLHDRFAEQWLHKRKKDMACKYISPIYIYMSCRNM